MPAAPLRTLQRGRLFALAPSLGLPGRSSRRSSRSMERERRLERETGIEPATNSLEGCDSTTELLPPTALRAPAWQARHAPHNSSPIADARSASANKHRRGGPLPTNLLQPAPTFARAGARRLVGRGGFEPP